MSAEPMRIVMAAPPADARGPMPKLAELLAAGLRQHGCEVVIVPWGGGGARSVRSRLAARAAQVASVRRAVRASRPHVLLVQTSHDWPSVLRDLALAVALLGRGCKLVLQLHGSRADLLVEPGHAAFKRATRRLLALVDGVLVLSSEERRAFAAFSPGRTFAVVVNPFVPRDGAAAVSNGHREGVPVVLFASRLLPEKGVLETVEAFAMLRRRLAARLVVAGEGPAAGDVARLARECDLGDDVTLAGHLPPDRLAASYRSAAVFALPTYHPEGFPTAISEAMSAGLPVVTSNLRGSADLLVEGTNALFVPPRDPAALAQALERLLTDDELRARMAAANRAKVAEFAPERVAGEYVRALNDVLGRNGAVTPDRLAGAARAAFELGERLDWRSYDPYDLLLSPVGAAVQARWWFGARLFVQLGRRSGAPARRLLRVPRHEEAKTLAEFLRAAVLLEAAGYEWPHAYAGELARRLVARAVPTPHGLGWALAFPYASRFVNVERGVPNLFVTTVACEALLDRARNAQDGAALDAALDGCRFILDGLGWFEHAGRPWLRYWAGADTATANVQASAAAMLARAGATSGDERLLDAADRAAAAALAAQRPDGSWSYSEDGRAPFVDGFHTGYTLQGLAEYDTAREGDAAAGAHAAVDRGFAYFVEHLLTSDGLPRGIADGPPSLDGQNVAQCVQTLVVCAREPAHLQSAEQLWGRCLPRLLSGGGDRFPALRWTVAPAVLATAYLASSSSSSAYASTIRASA